MIRRFSALALLTVTTIALSPLVQAQVMSPKPASPRAATPIAASLRAATPIAAAPKPASAETVLEKIARTGVLTAGTSSEAIPYAYTDKSGQLVGYSVDMLGLIKAQLEKRLGKSLRLQLVPLAPADRIPKILSREVDLVCDASSFTWERDRQVDFSLSYSLTGTKLLVKKGSPLSDAASFVGKRIGAIPGTTNALAVRKFQPRAEIVSFRTWQEAFQALEQGKIDAYAGDRLLLESRLAAQGKTEQYSLVPSRLLSQEGIACMLPENNSQFADSVNLALFRQMQLVIQKDKAALALFDRWFGPQGVVPLTQDYRILVEETIRLIVELREAL
jgi:polar amino acid transport system substrate-binding protein